MMVLDAAEKERLLAEFEASLWACDDVSADNDNTPDLHTLLSEMAALKNEVRLEARQSKNTLDELRRLVELLNQRNDQLEKELERAREHAASVEQQAEGRLIEHLLDLRDRLQAGADAFARWRPAAWTRMLPDARFGRQLGAGQLLVLQRIDQCLADYRIQAITALGQTLDPHRMRAVGVESRPDLPDGVVTSEVRRGFLRNGSVLRIAEVIVNKRTSS